MMCVMHGPTRAYAYAMWKVYIVLQFSKKACSIMELHTYIKWLSSQSDRDGTLKSLWHGKTERVSVS